MNDERDSQQEELRYNSNENANREEILYIGNNCTPPIRRD